MNDTECWYDGFTGLVTLRIGDEQWTMTGADLYAALNEIPGYDCLLFSSDYVTPLMKERGVRTTRVRAEAESPQRSEDLQPQTDGEQREPGRPNETQL